MAPEKPQGQPIIRPLSRRRFLTTAAAIGGSSLLPFHRSLAQAAPAAGPRRIDVHHHFLPPIYMEQERARVIASSDITPTALLHWTPAMALDQMDKYGVATAIVSLSTPGVWFGDAAAARRLSRGCNEYGAEMMRQHPGRFGLFAVIPLPDREGSLREIAYALDVLKADGIGILTSYGDKWPGDPDFAAVFDELNRRKAVVYVHPTAPGCCGNLIPGIPPSLDEFLFDTTRAITSLMMSGTFARCPDINFIFAHSGGTMMPLVARTAAFLRRHPELQSRVPNGVYYELKRLHYDIANSTIPSAMGALMAVVPTSQMLFGSDFPYVPIGVTANGLDHYGLAPAVQQAIDRGNALRLLPQLKTG